MTVADRIKTAREQQGLTQEELAKKMGYASKSAVSRTENAGDNIGQKRIKEFSKALNVSVAYLMGWEQEPSDLMKSLEKGIEKFPDSEVFKHIYNGSVQDSTLGPLTPDEINLVKAWRDADDELRKMIMRIIVLTKVEGEN